MHFAYLWIYRCVFLTLVLGITSTLSLWTTYYLLEYFRLSFFNPANWIGVIIAMFFDAVVFSSTFPLLYRILTLANLLDYFKASSFQLLAFSKTFTVTLVVLLIVFPRLTLPLTFCLSTWMGLLAVPEVRSLPYSFLLRGFQVRR